MERQLASSVEADVNGLRILLEEINREICHLQPQVENLQEELQLKKRNHGEVGYLLPLFPVKSDIYFKKNNS